MNKQILRLGLFIALSFLTVNFSYAQGKHNDVVASKSGNSRGIKYERPTTDVETPEPAKSRGSLCCVNFDNYTGYYVDIWVDGVYQGRVSPWKEGTVCVSAGYTTWYAESAGGTYKWNSDGSQNGTCSDYYNLKLK